MLSAAPALPTASPTRIDPRLLFWLILLISAAALYPAADFLGTIDHLRVPDTDDAMRLVRVRDLIAGQGWFDTVQHRFLPPDGMSSHWSRLVDLPLAGLILALTPLLGQNLAEGLTAALWPPLLLCLYGTIVFIGLRRFLNTRAAAFALLAVLQTPGLTGHFSPGRIDHHNVQVLAMLGLSLCLVRGGFVAAAFGGGLAALSLAVGLEGLPTLAAAAMFLLANWIVQGRPALAGLLGFGLGFGLASPLAFALQTAPSLWSATACDALSPPWLWLASGGMAATVACAALDTRLKGPAGRLALSAGLGLILVGGFAALFPVCLGGPFAEMPTLVYERWLRAVNEMGSVPTFIANGRWEMLSFYPPLLVAGLAAFWAARRGPPEQRRYFTIVNLFLWPGLVVSLDQFRGIYIAAGFIPLVAGPAIDRAFTLLENQRAAWQDRLASCVLGVALVPSIWMLPTYTATLISHADRGNGLACLSYAAVAPLASLDADVVLAPIDMGPAILLHTPHAIVAAPYHRASPGLLAVIEGLGGTEADLHRHMTARGARYLVSCPGHPAANLGTETAFATRLAAGEVTATWLERVPVPGTGLKVWRMR